MSDKNEKYYLSLDLIDYFVYFLLIFFSCASLVVLLFALSNFLGFMVLFPMICIISLTFYYTRLKTPLENLNRLAIIDLIIFLLYLICFLLIYFTLLVPQSFITFYYLLDVIHRFYYYLSFPLIYIIIITINYLKLNRSIGRKRFSIALIFLGFIITFFIVNYYLLDLSIPFLHDYYRSLPNWD